MFLFFNFIWDRVLSEASQMLIITECGWKVNASYDVTGCSSLELSKTSTQVCCILLQFYKFKFISIATNLLTYYRLTLRQFTLLSHDYSWPQCHWYLKQTHTRDHSSLHWQGWAGLLPVFTQYSALYRAQYCARYIVQSSTVHIGQTK